MRKKFSILLFCFILFSFFSIGQINFPGAKVDGKKLKDLFAMYEFIVVKIDAQSTVSFTVEGVNACDTTIIASGDFPSSGVNYPISQFENSPLVCFGKYSSFIPVTGHTYFLVPKVIREQGKNYLHLRIKDNTSTTSSYHKSINPIPPDHPGFMMTIQ